MQGDSVFLFSDWGRRKKGIDDLPWMQQTIESSLQVYIPSRTGGWSHYMNPWVGLLSQAAACDGLTYSVNYIGQNSGMQGYALPLFED